MTPSDSNNRRRSDSSGGFVYRIQNLGGLPNQSCPVTEHDTQNRRSEIAITLLHELCQAFSVPKMESKNKPCTWRTSFDESVFGSTRCSRSSPWASALRHVDTVGFPIGRVWPS